MSNSNQYYETYKESKLVQSKTTVDVKTPVNRSKKPNILKSRLDNFIEKLKGKKSRKLSKAERSVLREQQKRGILGIGLLLVVVSITFSTFVTITFVDDKAIYLALAPQIAFAIFSLFKAFSKIYK